MINIVEHFDPYNMDHIIAYGVLDRTGSWPEDFMDWRNVRFPPFWRLELLTKMSRAWEDAMRAGRVKWAPRADRPVETGEI